MKANSGQLLSGAATGSHLPELVAYTANLVNGPLAVLAAGHLNILRAALNYGCVSAFIETLSNLSEGASWLLGVSSHAVVVIRYYSSICLFLHKNEFSAGNLPEAHDCSSWLDFDNCCCNLAMAFS